MEDLQIQELLNKLLAKELELLRKRFKPYKRSSFLHNKVIIKVVKDEPNVAGYYVNTKKKKRQYRYTHEVCITQTTIDNYKIYCKYHMKKIGKQNLIDVIRHELIHAFVFEEFEEWEYIEGCHRDYSPIFLGCLYWANGVSYHTYINEFNNTDLCKSIKECNNYDSVHTILLRYIFSLEETVRNINKDIGPFKELGIRFNSRGAGIVKNTYLKQKSIFFCENKKTKMVKEYLELGIGFLVDSNRLLGKYSAKFTNGSLAEYHDERKLYFKGENILNETIVLSNLKR